MDTADTYDIFLVDDHPIVRRGYASLLNRMPRFVVAGEAGSGEEALDRIPQAMPDLAIVDISMTGMNGFELTQELQVKHPELPVLIISMYDETEYVRQALKAGAKGYLTKDEVGERIVDAVSQILSGEIFLPESIRQKMA